MFWDTTDFIGIFFLVFPTKRLLNLYDKKEMNSPLQHMWAQINNVGSTDCIKNKTLEIPL